MKAILLNVTLIGIGFVWSAQVVRAQRTDLAASETPVALVDGRPISEAELESAAAAQLAALHRQEYQIKKEALENLVNRKLIEAEAKRKGVLAEKLLETEVDSKLGEPSDAEVRAYYLGQQDRLNRPYSEIEAQIRSGLKQSRIQQGRQDYLQGLRKAAGVAILLRPNKVDVSADPARVRGNPKASVTIIEFSDFQCPYCQGVQAALREVLAKYEGRVALAYRDFPLNQIHPQAQVAAEASRCAAAQGRFWEYHDFLFSNQSMLQEPGLIEGARKLGLDEAGFQSCLTSHAYKDDVAADQQIGLRAGVTGTPAFFINGIYLNGNQPASEFTRIIDEEFAAIRLKAQSEGLLTRKEDKRNKN